MKINLSKWLFELLFAEFIKSLDLDVGAEWDLPPFKTKLPGGVYVENVGQWRLRRYK